MSDHKKTLLLFALAILVFGFWRLNTPHRAKGAQTDESRQQEELPSQSPAPTAPSGQSTAAGQTSAAEAIDGKLAKASLEDMSRTLFQFTRPESRLTDLVDYLEGSRQQPLVTHNSNPDTGDMAIVRTRSPLPGTRYFHAQYFTDENQKSFVQHMSFEFQPGTTAMNDAVGALQKVFPDLPAPKTQSGDFVQWNVPGGYVLWVKKMTASDLQDDPFNAYTPDDVGTVRVAMEVDVHGDDAEGEAHQHQ